MALTPASRAIEERLFAAYAEANEKALYELSEQTHGVTIVDKPSSTHAQTADSATKAATAEIATSCSGNSATASKLETSRKIKFSGDAQGEVNFDGSADIVVNIENVRANNALNDRLGNDIVDTYVKKIDLEKYVTNADLKAEYVTKSESELTEAKNAVASESYAKKEDLEEYVQKDELESYATKSELESYAKADSVNENFLTKSEAASTYATKSESSSGGSGIFVDGNYLCWKNGATGMLMRVEGVQYMPATIG